MDLITYALSKKYTQKQIADLGEIFSIKGSIQSIDDLPSTATAGDLYFVDDNSSEYVYTDSGTWEQIGPVFDTSSLMAKGVDYVTAGKKANSSLGTKATAEGRDTIAAGAQSHAEGLQTIANGNNQHVFGQYNIADNSNTYIEIVGRGDANNNRQNARTLDWNGNEVLAGKITVGADPTNAMDVATKQYVDQHSGGGTAGEDYHIIHFQVNENTGEIKSVETTEEIYSMMTTGQPIYFEYTDEDDSYLSLISVDYDYENSDGEQSGNFMPMPPGFYMGSAGEPSYIYDRGSALPSEGYFYIQHSSGDNVLIAPVTAQTAPFSQNQENQTTIATLEWSKYYTIDTPQYPNLALKIPTVSNKVPIGITIKIIINNIDGSQNIVVKNDSSSGGLWKLIFENQLTTITIEPNVCAIGTITYIGSGIGCCHFDFFDNGGK